MTDTPATKFSVGDRVKNRRASYYPPATVTEITERGFKYDFDYPQVLSPRLGSMVGGESYDDEQWELEARVHPTVDTNAAKWLVEEEKIAAMFPDFGWPDRMSFSEAIAEQLTQMTRIKPTADIAQLVKEATKRILVADDSEIASIILSVLQGHDLQNQARLDAALADQRRQLAALHDETLAELERVRAAAKEEIDRLNLTVNHLAPATSSLLQRAETAEAQLAKLKGITSAEGYRVGVEAVCDIAEMDSILDWRGGSTGNAKGTAIRIAKAGRALIPTDKAGNSEVGEPENQK